MARRAPLDEPEKVIQVILEDGGVILTGFADPADVDKVNSDSAPYTKVNDDVCYVLLFLLIESTLGDDH